jgi:hypothetical protein
LKSTGAFIVTTEKHKKRFICYELGQLSLKEALSTRDDAAPVYAKGLKPHQRRKERKALPPSVRIVVASLESLSTKLRWAIESER